MENMVSNDFWKNKKVFITGHTGFKGSWLTAWLDLFGAKLSGYALEPPTNPSLFEAADLGKVIDSTISDIRDYPTLARCIEEAQPDIVMHLAAQPLVLDSYSAPVDTFATNVMGTVNLLEACRRVDSIKVILNVTTDKVYENQEWIWPYRENEPLGGHDPYAGSKACSEIVSNTYWLSFFKEGAKALATARAGNVIGGGDWASNRLVPDCVNALLNGETVTIRNPDAVRPWQHVLEPLGGYMLLCERLFENAEKYSGAWNLGPNHEDERTVKEVTEKLFRIFDEKNTNYKFEKQKQQEHEANLLRLDHSKASQKLGWHPRWNLDRALEMTVEWAKSFRDSDVKKLCTGQIEAYLQTPAP